MKQIKSPIASLLVLVTALVLTVGTPVFAHNGEHHGGDDSTSSSSGNSSSKVNRSTAVTKTETGHGTEIEVHRSSPSELKQKAQTDLAERKQKGKAQSEDQRKKVCEARKQGLNTKFDRIVKNSQRIQGRIDGILHKAVNYKSLNNFNPADWDSLIAAAGSAQSASSASIVTLSDLEPTVDCNNTSVASDVATFKAAAAETRDNLKAYRDSVKAVLKPLAEAKKTTTEGSD